MYISSQLTITSFMDHYAIQLSIYLGIGIDGITPESHTLFPPSDARQITTKHIFKDPSKQLSTAKPFRVISSKGARPRESSREDSMFETPRKIIKATKNKD